MNFDTPFWTLVGLKYFGLAEDMIKSVKRTSIQIMIGETGNRRARKYTKRYPGWLQAYIIFPSLLNPFIHLSLVIENDFLNKLVQFTLQHVVPIYYNLIITFPKQITRVRVQIYLMDNIYQNIFRVTAIFWNLKDILMNTQNRYCSKKHGYLVVFLYL